MSKDIIFAKKPTVIRKKYDYCALPYAGRSYRHDQNNRTHPTYITINNVDLKNYRQVKLNELLKKDDIYYSQEKERWVFTQLVDMTPSVTYQRVYYRKIDFNNKPPYIDLKVYKMLFPSDVIEEGDEFWGGTGDWTITRNAGHKVGHIHFYRRKLKPL